MIHRLSGRGVLIWLAGFFGVIIAVNAWFITASVRSFSGEDEQQPFLQGITYNQTLARRAEQKALDWRAAIAGTRRDGTVRIAVRVSQRDGAPQAGLTLHGELRHPADEKRDRPLQLKETSPGLYQADLAQVARGSWDVIVATGGRQAPFEATRRLWLP